MACRVGWAMCLLVFVASDYPLPTLPWDQSKPRFHVTELTERDEPVKDKFSKPYVYYAGSHKRCGCGFQYGEYESFEEDTAALAAAQDSRRQLTEFLAIALQHQQTVEVFACWDGDQGKLPKCRGFIRPVELIGGRTSFRECEFLVLSESLADHRDGTRRAGS
jgi:hypothetical protein